MTLAALLLADGRFPAGGHAHSAGIEAACADGRVTDESNLEEFVVGRLRTTGLVDASLAAATVLTLTDLTAGRRRSAGDVGDGTRPPLDAESRRTPVELDADADWCRAVLALDAEAEARITAPPLRDASRQLGRQLVRVGRRCWPHDVLARVADMRPSGVHQPVALGAVGVAAGCDAAEVARLAVHHVLTTPAQAAVRLLGLDPFGVAAVVAGLGPLGTQVAADAVDAARRIVLTPERGQDVGRSPTEGLDVAGWASRLADLPALASPLVEIAAVEHAAWEVRMFAT